ncbi:hypothetical protein O181_023607 [Austropuccinia psidii MF-1]|uniref:Uncharacterized protein n=1 Tax=Austropuccinia psidii MF-1 TaxID=1389203 RepID=A0A9Q3CHN8_9BASI|nr:hypothetical protein [Austropuccinia psidii MF-1]
MAGSSVAGRPFERDTYERCKTYDYDSERSWVRIPPMDCRDFEQNQSQRTGVRQYDYEQQRRDEWHSGGGRSPPLSLSSNRSDDLIVRTNPDSANHQNDLNNV